MIWPGAGADVQYGGQGNDVLHALANDNQPDILDCGPGYDVAYVIVHDPGALPRLRAGHPAHAGGSHRAGCRDDDDS